ncbi:MAG: amino acid-binding protein [Eubacteriales bacterium]
MKVKQISVFLENKQGRLQEVLQALADNEINLVAMYLADTAEYGMLRLIVSDPEKGRKVLKDLSLNASIVEVVAIRVPHACGSLCTAMTYLVEAGINVEYMYAFANGEDASFIFKTKTPDKAIEIVTEKGFKVYTSEEAYVLNQ